MADLSPGSHANLILDPDDVVRVTASGQTTVDALYGAPAGLTSLTAQTSDFGPYGVQAKLRVTAISGRTTYGTVRPADAGPVFANGSRGVGSVLSAVLGAGWSVSGYQWVRVTNGIAVDISGATSATYTQQAADVAEGVAVRVRVSGLSFTRDVLAAAAAAPAPAPTPAPAPAPTPAPTPAPAPAPTPAPPPPADTRPRWFLAPSNAHTTNAASLVSGGTVLTGSANGGKTGSMTITTTTGNYAWAAFAVPAGTTSYTVTFTDQTAGGFAGGWSGAGLAGANTGASPANSVTTTMVTVDNQLWALFREDYPNAHPTPANFTTA